MYKTIVLHVGSAASLDSSFPVAAALANRMRAHLVGSAVSGLTELNYMLFSETPAAIPTAADVQALQDDARRRLELFAQRCRDTGVESWESRMSDASAIDTLLLQSRYSDLLLAGQADLTEHTLWLPPSLPGQLVTRAPRPVLLVPAAHTGQWELNTLMIAWNGSTGASRAVAAALPLMRLASRVCIALCNPQLERTDMGAEPGADLATYLARHHPRVELLRFDTTEELGAALCHVAQDCHADLMVAGAYGHSRLHDWVLGSTTGSLIERMPVPLLMMH